MESNARKKIFSDFLKETSQIFEEIEVQLMSIFNDLPKIDDSIEYPTFKLEEIHEKEKTKIQQNQKQKEDESNKKQLKQIISILNESDLHSKNHTQFTIDTTSLISKPFPVASSINSIFQNEKETEKEKKDNQIEQNQTKNTTQTNPLGFQTVQQQSNPYPAQQFAFNQQTPTTSNNFQSQQNYNQYFYNTSYNTSTSIPQMNQMALYMQQQQQKQQQQQYQQNTQQQQQYQQIYPQQNQQHLYQPINSYNSYSLQNQNQQQQQHYSTPQQPQNTMHQQTIFQSFQQYQQSQPQKQQQLQVPVLSNSPSFDNDLEQQVRDFLNSLAHNTAGSGLPTSFLVMKAMQKFPQLKEKSIRKILKRMYDEGLLYGS